MRNPDIMASSSSLLSQINADFLTCQICMDSFTAPKVLNCQHTFCLSCLESCEKSESGSYMSCPVCRQQTLLGMKGVSGLRDNFVFSSMIEMMETWNRSKGSLSPRNRSAESLEDSEIMCSTCPTEVQIMAIFRCLDCLDHLCADCAAFHKRTKLTKEHEVVSLDEIESGAYEEKIRRIEQSRCSEHETQMLHYCHSCQAMVCKDCIIESHQTHQINTIEEAGQEKREQVTKLNKAIGSGIDQLEEQIKEAESKKMQETTRYEDARIEINSKMTELVEFIKKRQNHLLDEINKAENINVSKVEGSIVELRTQVKCMDNCVQLSNHLLQSNNHYEILAMHHRISDTVAQLDKKTAEVIKRNKETMETLTNVKVKFGELDEAIKTFGIISIEGFETVKLEVSENHTENSASMEDEVFNTGNTASQSQGPPKAAPRRNTSFEASTRPKPKVRLTQAITTKELEKLDNMISLTTPRPKGRVAALSSLSSEPNLARSMESLNSTSSSPERSPITSPSPILTRKTQAPKPPPKKPTVGPPLPPPQSKKPIMAQNLKPLPLRGVLYTKFGRKGKILTNGEFLGPSRCVAFSKLKNKIFALDANSKHVLIFNAEGVFKKSFKVIYSDQAKPVSVTEFGKISLLVLFKNFITEWAWDGRIVNHWGETDLNDANCITTDSQGRILVSDQGKNMIFIYDYTTKSKILQLGGFGDRDNLFKSPRYISTNNADDIIISDHHNHCVKVFDKTGKFLFKCGGKGTYDGELKYPEGVATVKLADGNEGILVADEGNSRISLFTHEGIFLGHIITKADDKNIKDPQNISISKTGEEMVVRQANQIGIRVYKLFTVGA